MRGLWSLLAELSSNRPRLPADHTVLSGPTERIIKSDFTGAVEHNAPEARCEAPRHSQ